MDSSEETVLVVHAKRLQAIATSLLSAALGDPAQQALESLFQPGKGGMWQRQKLCNQVVELANDLCHALDDEMDGWEIGADFAEKVHEAVARERRSCGDGWTPPT